MITKEQIDDAIDQHNAEADMLDNLARHLRGPVCALVRKQDGKQISKRLYLPICAAAGLKAEQTPKGATFYRDAEWKAFFDGRRHDRRVRVEIGTRGDYQDIPLIAREYTDRLDAAATIARLEKIAETCGAWAAEKRVVASHTAAAAAEYNKIQVAVVALLDKLDDIMNAAFPDRYNSGFLIMSGLGRKYCSHLYNFKWESVQ